MPIQSKAIIKNEFNGVQYAIELLYTFNDGLTSRIKCRGNSVEEGIVTNLDAVLDRIVNRVDSAIVKDHCSIGYR